MKDFISKYGYIFIVVIIVLFIRLVVFDIVKVEGKSMEPTIVANDKLFIDKISSYLKSYSRGDLIILEAQNIHKGKNPYWVKRIIAVSGDIVECKNNKLTINGLEINENYLQPGIITSDIEKQKVPQNHVYILGDNRESSLDSRKIGFISYDKIVGKVIFTF